MLTYVTTLNLVRLGIKHKLTFIKIPKNTKSQKILQILVKLNVIYGWSVLQKVNKPLYLVYCNPKAAKIHTFIKVNRKINIKYKKIKILSSRYSISHIFLSTPQGLLSMSEAFKLKTGGFLFFRIV